MSRWRCWPKSGIGGTGHMPCAQGGCPETESGSTCRERIQGENQCCLLSQELGSDPNCSKQTSNPGQHHVQCCYQSVGLQGEVFNPALELPSGQRCCEVCQGTQCLALHSDRWTKFFWCRTCVVWCCQRNHQTCGQSVQQIALNHHHKGNALVGTVTGVGVDVVLGHWVTMGAGRHRECRAHEPVRCAGRSSLCVLPQRLFCAIAGCCSAVRPRPGIRWQTR